MASQSNAVAHDPGAQLVEEDRNRTAHRMSEGHDLVEPESIEDREYVTGDVRERALGEIGRAFARAMTTDVDPEGAEFVTQKLRDGIEEAGAEPVGVLEQQRRPGAAPVERIDAETVVLDHDRAGIGHGAARYPTSY